MGLVITFDGETLADGLPTGSLVMDDALIVNGERIVQVEELIRADEITVFDRQTIRNDLGFSVLTQRTGLVQALNAALRRRETLAGVGTLTITCEVDSVTHAWTATVAAIPRTTSRNRGAATEIQYSITCGQFAYTASSAAGYAGDDEDGGNYTASPTDDEDGGHYSDNLATADIDGGSMS